MRFILLLTLHFCLSAAYGQSFSLDPMPMRSLDIAFDKTTTLVFPYPLQSIDRGSTGVLVKKLAGVDNILLVKAAKKGFTPTNLSVITQGGRLFAFMLRYKAEPSALHLKIEPSDLTDDLTDEVSSVQLSAIGDRKALLTAQARRVLGKLPVFRRKTRLSGLHFAVLGLYAAGDCLYVKVRIENRRAVPVAFHPLRITKIRSRRMKRSGAQEVEIRPLLVFPKVEKLEPGSRRELVVAMKAISLNRDQRLHITLSGSEISPLTLKLNRRHFLKTRMLHP